MGFSCAFLWCTHLASCKCVKKKIGIWPLCLFSFFFYGSSLILWYKCSPLHSRTSSFTALQCLLLNITEKYIIIKNQKGFFFFFFWLVFLKPFPHSASFFWRSRACYLPPIMPLYLFICITHHSNRKWVLCCWSFTAVPWHLKWQPHTSQKNCHHAAYQYRRRPGSCSLHCTLHSLIRYFTVTSPHSSSLCIHCGSFGHARSFLDRAVRSCFREDRKWPHEWFMPGLDIALTIPHVCSRKPTKRPERLSENSL